MEKLRALGWDEDLDMMGDGYGELAAQAVVKQPKELTNKGTPSGMSIPSHRVLTPP